MDEQEEARDTLDVPETDEGAPKGVTLGNRDWREDGYSLAEVAETVVKDTSIDTRGDRHRRRTSGW